MENPATATKVLCLGHDLILLKSRQWILQRSSCTVETVTSVSDYKLALAFSNPDVIVLCQTLSPEECMGACETAMRYCPDSRILLMFTRIEKCTPPCSYHLLRSTDGPQLFSETVLDLLHRPVAQAEAFR